MAENINFENMDFRNDYGVSPPRDGSRLELLRFSRNVDAAEIRNRVKYYKLKEVISTNTVDSTASNDEFVDTVAEVVLDRVGGQIGAALAPLVEAINQLNTRFTRVEHAVAELRADFRNAEIKNRIRSTQTINVLNRCMLGKPAETVCFYTGENPIELGLPPLKTAADVDRLSLSDIDRYCTGYRLPGLVWNNEVTTGCKAQKESIRNFVRLANVIDMEQKMTDNQTN